MEVPFVLLLIGLFFAAVIDAVEVPGARAARRRAAPCRLLIFTNGRILREVPADHPGRP
ncbi:hypothetical protein [Shinella sp.]|uniref:hypothetical protein n=1 Tax=Shinella sp. TaxID=1870904 RepID=UPI0025906782|nr:hypothetical protein [Shinella sp.]MCO5136263.1 hypothetical protein [Shinella sp.]